MARYLDIMDNLLSSDNAVEQMFVDACKALKVGTQLQDVGEHGNPMVATRLMKGETAYAALELLRDEGFEVMLTQAIFMPDCWAIVLVGK
jgi:hypothetical protein